MSVLSLLHTGGQLAEEHWVPQRWAPFGSTPWLPPKSPQIGSLCDEVHLNLAYRWFCRLGLDGTMPDHSTFSKNRHGRFRDSDLLRTLFEQTTALAMVTHELATNSVEYGSLSAEIGFLDGSSKMDGDFILVTWTETGGPPITEAQALKGFGSKLIARRASSAAS